MKEKKTQGRPTKTVICPTPSDTTIHIKDDDYIHYDKVDSQGYIRPNKRDWKGLKATVLIGAFDAPDGLMFVPAGTHKFLCEVLSNAYVSSVSSEYSGQDVTLIVHHVNKK